MPVLGADIDDTMAKYLKGVRASIIRKEDKFFKGMSADEITSHFPDLDSYDDFAWTLINSERAKFEQYHCEAVEQGLFRDLEVMQGASEALWRLKEEHDFHIYVITSRFVRNGQHARVLADTGVWLDANNIPYDDIMFARNKVDVVADVYIDDSPKNITALRAAGRKVVVYDRSYNRDFAGPRAHNWTEGYDILSTILN